MKKAPWSERAKKYGKSYKATTLDPNIKKLEIDRLGDGPWWSAAHDILEVGCGNGVNLAGLKKLYPKKTFSGFDSDQNMVDAAKRLLGVHDMPVWREDIVHMDAELLVRTKGEAYDIVITDRCIINILNENDQKKAIKNIMALLKPGGFYLMLENFESKYDTQNFLRNTIGLETRKHADYNKFLSDDLIEWCKTTMSLYVEDNFAALHNLLLYVLLPKAYPKYNRHGRWHYNHPIMKAATELLLKDKGANPAVDCGQNHLMVWRKG